MTKLPMANVLSAVKISAFLPHDFSGDICYNFLSKFLDAQERIVNMYEVGHLVVYGIHGVCRIVAVEVKTVDRKQIPYFVLEPIEQPGTRYYIPSQNQTALCKIRHLMDRQSLLDMLSADATEEDWIDDENKRKQYYQQIINGVDSPALLRMVHALCRHKSRQETQGRKLHLCDENFLRDAQRVLNAEMAAVLQIPAAEVPAFMRQQLERK